MIRRLYLKVYAALVGTLIAALVVSATLFAVTSDSGDLPRELRGAIELVVRQLPPPGDAHFREDLEGIARQVDADLTLRGPDGRVLGTVGRPAPGGEDGVFHDRRSMGVRVTLRDGRQVTLTSRRQGPPWRGHPWAFLGVLGGVLALGALPVARGITRRLEATREAVVAWGRGDLDARAPVVGADEVAEVATAFNEAASRVSAQLQAQRRTLASVSHELRSPLARVRLALELLDDGDEPRRALVADAVRDVEELDATVGDLLDVGRLQAVGVTAAQPVELRTLVEEEATHVGAAVRGERRVVVGDPRLLRRLLRNLLENAVRHGAGQVEAWTTAEGLVVADRGPGVPEAEREAIFEPFHRAAHHAEGRDGGVGLGLWLVREIATRHGGDVRCLPREGGGTCFAVTLPATTKPPDVP